MKLILYLIRSYFRQSENFKNSKYADSSGSGTIPFSPILLLASILSVVLVGMLAFVMISGPGDLQAKSNDADVQQPVTIDGVSASLVLNASHILIAYQGAEGASEEVTRSQDEAEALANEVMEKATAEGADFAALAKEYSDDPSSEEGGALGDFPATQAEAEFSKVTDSLDVGEVSKPVLTKAGYHVILRNKIQASPSMQLRAAHILIAFRGASRADANVTRTQAEAAEFAQEIANLARAEGADFAALAKEHSDGPSGARGGDMPAFAYSKMAPTFSCVTARLEAGSVSDPVLTPFGYHVILRKEVK